MPSLSEILELDLNWRESELASFKAAILSSDRKTIRESALLRGAWAILYSHYEGFCKFAWDSYLDELEKKQVPRSQLCGDMAALSLRKSFKTLRGALSDKDLWEFGNKKFSELQSTVATFEEKLDTDSNLWPNLYRENAHTLGIQPTYIDKYATQIKTLVSRRNDIAHGQKMIIKDIQEYAEYESAALLVMHDLALCLIEAAESESYKLKA
ncbi:MAE_28990/MAE_18760 family HEPN-like nuclease [Pseudomonas sp. R45(2017)]|uniref:MAE_28990/MAE_18760 family HEPN-like nuclease n=1 Tax=Pseudomonas sp. R45(2017) TaxID=1981678 RepID=UPI00111C83A0|nr:MAE_28990/MAE_18760 family HEPN-like nuclease [Pseudomonas sp. R45(2017)]